MKIQNEYIDSRETRLIELVKAGFSMEKIAEKLGVHKRTVHRLYDKFVREEAARASFHSMKDQRVG